MLLKPTLFAAAATVLALGPAANANAAATPCYGTINSSWVNAYGAVLIRGSWRGDHTQICSISEVWKGIPAEVCFSWVAKADAAVSTGAAVIVYYFDIGSCASIPTYGDSPAPYYLMLQR